MNRQTPDRTWIEEYVYLGRSVIWVKETLAFECNEDYAGIPDSILLELFPEVSTFGVAGQKIASTIQLLRDSFALAGNGLSAENSAELSEIVSRIRAIEPRDVFRGSYFLFHQLFNVSDLLAIRLYREVPERFEKVTLAPIPTERSRTPILMISILLSLTLEHLHKQGLYSPANPEALKLIRSVLHQWSACEKQLELFISKNTTGL